jgi:sulfonate transport system substrate-binding protein
MLRRTFLASVSALAFASLAHSGAAKAEPLKEIRIGYQKTGALLVVKARRVLEQRFELQGVGVKWVEFQFGPPLLEALSAGAIDYGYTGDAPPIFAQAAKARIAYVAAIPARGEGQAILVKKGSAVKTLADLKGRKIGVAKGSSAHNLLISALEAEGVAYNEISPVYLTPADASAAFAKGAIDAWSIWDPFYAIAELKADARPLPIAQPATIQNSYFLANREFVTKNPEIVAAIGEEIAKATRWAGENRAETAALYAEASGVDLAAQQRAVNRAEFSFDHLSERIIAEQQAVADRFQALGLIPARIVVRDIVWAGKPKI